jgi:predicted acyltransferase
LPGPEFDYSKVGVTDEWLAAYGVTGFAAHWQKNSHLAWAFDTWFLNLFPRSTPYSGQANGLATLNFIPLVGTMILGLLAGRVLRSDRSDWGKISWFAVAGVTGLSTGWLLSRLGICPLAKPIWTPSWVLFSGGWCFLFLGAHYALVDVWGRRWLVFPLIVVGMNSIAAYCLAKVYPAFAWNSLRRIFGGDIFRVFGDAYEDLAYGVAILACYWLLLFLMYQKKMFLRI